MWDNLPEKIIHMKKQVLIIMLAMLTMAASGQVLTLDSCLSLTLANNKKINEARLKVEQAEQVKKNAFTNYFPQVNAGFAAMKANDYILKEEVPEMNLPVYDGNPANLLTPTQFAYFPGMDLNILDYTNLGYVAAVEPVYMGGQIRNGNKLAALGQDIDQYALILSEEDALIKTEQQYWTLISLKEKMKTIISYEDLLDALYQDVSVAYEAGLIEKSDRLKVTLKQNELAGKKLKLQNGIEMLSMALCQNMGIQYSPSIEFLSTEINNQGIENFFLNPDTAIQGRQEFIMLHKAVEAEKLQKKIARGEILPQLAVGVQGYYLDMMDKSSTNALVFATLNVPLSGWWGGSHKIKEHQIKVDIAENRLSENTELMLLQVQKSYKELIESYQQISIAEETVKEAEEHLRVIRDNFDAGLVGTSDLLEAQAMFQEAQDQYSDAQCTAQIRLAQYKKSTANYGK
jgi:outer membrane protein TolC